MTHTRIILHRILSDIRQNFTALLILLIYMVAAQYFFHTVCPWAIMTGTACPACGLTRSALLLLTGDPAGAFRMNPSIYLWVPCLLYLSVQRYILGRKPPAALPLTVLVCIITILIHLWRMKNGTAVPVPAAILNFPCTLPVKMI